MADLASTQASGPSGLDKAANLGDGSGSSTPAFPLPVRPGAGLVQGNRTGREQGQYVTVSLYFGVSLKSNRTLNTRRGGYIIIVVTIQYHFPHCPFACY